MTTVIEFYVPEKERKKTIKILSGYFGNKTCIKIEKGIYDFTRQFCESNGSNLIMANSIYKDKVDDIIFNLNQQHATIIKITKKINKKQYNPYNLAFLRPDELDEDNWMKIVMRRQLTEDKLKNLPTIEWNSCRNCKHTEYFYYQLQTRSADEPMTTFYICKNCDKTYKVNN